MMKKIKKSFLFLSIGFLVLVSACSKVSNLPNAGNSNETGIISQKIDYYTDNIYPIIFIHGHGINSDIENTWTFMINKLDGQEGYKVYSETIYEDTDLPSRSLSPRTLFNFGFYRSNSGDSFGSKAGHIGGIPKTYTGGSGNSYYNWSSSDRVSFASRLEKSVDEILEATGASQVIIVAHSMGGLVSRSYIRWLSGSSKVRKLLTIGTPNKGIPNDMRLWLKKNSGTPEWQWHGELEEMSKADNFGSHSFTEWLNDGWSSFCLENGIEYATIRGDFNPIILPFVHIGDGVVDKGDAVIDGAKFNAEVYASHIKKMPFANESDDEQALTHTTFVLETIKRWLIQDQIHVDGAFSKFQNNPNYFTNYPNPFLKETSFEYHAEGNPVYVQMNLFNSAGNQIQSYGYGLPIGTHSNRFTFNLGHLSAGVYIMNVIAYDMDGKIFIENVKIAKAPGENDIKDAPNLIFLETPERTTNQKNVTFKINVDNYSNGVKYSYKLNTGNWTEYSEANNTISFNNLIDGSYTAYFRATAFQETISAYSNLLSFHWTVGNISNIEIYDEIISENNTFQAKSEIKIWDSTIKSGAHVKLIASDKIDIGYNFNVESGASFDAMIQ